MDSLISLAFLCVLLLSAFGLGRPLVRTVGQVANLPRNVGQVANLPQVPRQIGNLPHVVWSIVVGLVAGSGVVLILGSIGLLCPPAIVLLTAAGTLCGLGELLYDRMPRDASEKASTRVSRTADQSRLPIHVLPPPDRWLTRGALIVTGAACLGSLLTALTPPTGDDALRRLDPAKRCLVERDFSAFAAADAGPPNLTDAWHIWAIALDGGVCAQLVDWSIAPLLALIAVVLAAPLVGRQWAWIAGAAVAVAAVGVHPASQPPQGVLGGLLLLAALPGLLLARRLRGLGLALIGAVAYTIVGLVVRASPWLLLPAVPPLAVAATWVWIELRRLPPVPRRIAQTALATLAVSAAAVAINVPRDRLAVAVGLEDRDGYLVRHAPTYPAAAVANAILKTGAHLLSEDDCTFHFDCRVTRVGDFRREAEADPPADPAERCKRLRAAGFTHLLLVDPDESGPSADDALLTLTEYRHVAPDGVARHYRLVMLR